MRQAAGDLVGEQDFASFCRAPESGSTVRTVERLAISRRGAELEIVARANAFLHQMVRSLVGTLVDVGEDRIDPGSMPEILSVRDRRAAGRLAPPHGLILERVVYATRPSRGAE
jgi:tRNA pseudouridine38-40 synthase